MTCSNLPCATYSESCGFGLRQKQTKIVMELPVACRWEKTSVPFPAWRQCCNHQWMHAPPSPWLTFKEQKPAMTQTGAPYSTYEKKIITLYYTLSPGFLPAHVGRWGSQHDPDHAGKRACSILQLALLHQSSPFPFFSSRASALLPCAICHAREQAKKRQQEMEAGSFDGFRRAPASTKG